MYGSLVCIHRYELGQARHRRKKCSTDFVPFKHVRAVCEEFPSHRTILKCVYPVCNVQVSGITHQGQNARVLALERRAIWASKETSEKGESRLKLAAAKVGNAQLEKKNTADV